MITDVYMHGRLLAFGVAALLVSVSSLAYAQATPWIAQFNVFYSATIIPILIIILAAMIYFLVKTRHLSIRLIVAGLAIGLMGMAVWFYGDLNNNWTYIGSGLAAVLVGTVMWVSGDKKGGAFDPRIAELEEPVRGTTKPKRGINNDADID